MRRLLSVIVFASVVGGLVAGGYTIKPDRSLSNDDAFYGGQVVAFYPIERGAAVDLEQSLETPASYDADWTSAIYGYVGAIQSTHEAVINAGFQLSGDADEVQDALLAISGDLNAAAQDCDLAVRDEDEDAMTACIPAVNDARRDLEDFIKSVEDWIEGDEFSFNRD